MKRKIAINPKYIQTLVHLWALHLNKVDKRHILCKTEYKSEYDMYITYTERMRGRDFIIK